jgi:hypothetical protein
MLTSLFWCSLKDFLPKEYVKQKGERKIFQVNGVRGKCLG